MAASHRLDGPALYCLLDYKRRQLGVSWREVQRATGCHSSRIFTHLRRDNGGLSSDTLLSLLAWLDLVHAVEGITIENEVYE
jgi:hypothetical protein